MTDETTPVDESDESNPERFPVQCSIRAPHENTHELLLEVLREVNTESVSTTAAAFRDAVIENPGTYLDTGTVRDDWDWNTPCPDCGSETLVIFSVTDDTFTVTEDGDAYPVDTGVVWENPIVMCAECEAELFRQPGY